MFRCGSLEPGTEPENSIKQNDEDDNLPFKRPEDEDDDEEKKMLAEMIKAVLTENDDDDDDDNDDDDEDEDEDEDDEIIDVDEEGKLLDLQRASLHAQHSSVKAEILAPISNPFEELDKLVGCDNIKKHIEQLIALNRYNHLMRCFTTNGKEHDVAMHGLFLGSPGTGKTTVCKIYGSLLHEAGMLSNGHVVVCNRGTFLGGSWGDEEQAVRQVVEMAHGGVLMIDEAYLLNSNHPNDPAKLVIPMLMDILANEQKRDIAVILCGYKEEMGQLIELNPGLDSRFPNRFEFPEFSIDDLLEITRRRIRVYNYHFTRTAWEKYRHLLAEAYNSRDNKTWGNARFVANQLEHIYLRHAVRCTKLKNPQKSHVFSITPADIEPIESPKPKKKIGF